MKTRRGFFRASVPAIAGVLVGTSLYRKSKAALPCGLLCTVLVVAIVVGIVTYLSIKALKGCEKLKKQLDRNHPDDDDDTVTPVNLPTNCVPHVSYTPLHHDAPSVDISDLGYTDPNGNIYCVASDVFLEACGLNAQGQPDGQWQPEGKIETYASFASASAMNWSESQQCYPALMSGQIQPQGIKTKYYDRAGVLVGYQYHSFNSGNASCECVTISPPVSAPAKFIRLRSPVT